MGDIIKLRNTEYGKALLQVADDLYSQIQQLWNEAVESGLEAAHTQTAENKKAADMGGVKEQAREYGEGYNLIREKLAKQGLDLLSEKLGNRFPFLLSVYPICSIMSTNTFRIFSPKAY